jgi:hypothetical protein
LNKDAVAKAPKAVSNAGAITKNLEENLESLIKKVERIAGREGVDALPPHAQASKVGSRSKVTILLLPTRRSRRSMAWT